MPRKTSLGERESAICGRLQEFRKQTGLSRIAFAQKIKIDSSVLVRYEHARMPLRFEDFCAIHAQFGIDPKWLVTGQGTAVRTNRLSTSILADCPSRALFSEVYDTTLARICEDPAVEIHERIDQLAHAAEEITQIIESRRSDLGPSFDAVEPQIKKAVRAITTARKKSPSLIGAYPRIAQLVANSKSAAIRSKK